MATGDYCLLATLKRELYPDDLVPDGVNDADLARVITAVSREFDNYTGTRFYDYGSDETRYFSAQDANTCWIDPATTITSVATDDDLNRNYATSWTVSTHYETWPYNTTRSRGLPVVRIDRSPLSDYQFPLTPRSVKVVGRFCWNAGASPGATIADIRQACILQCIRWFKRPDAPFGTLGPTAEGQISVIPGLDPDIKRVLDRYRNNYT